MLALVTPKQSTSNPMKNRLTYLLFRALLYFLKWLPFPALYVCSNIVYFLLFKVFHYRRQVVQQHLLKAFPHHSRCERKQLEKSIFRNLADVSLESLKGYSMSYQQLLARWHTTNPDILQPYYDRNQSIILVSGHFSNWEWGIILGEQIPHHCIEFYKPIHNQLINNYLLQCRSSGRSEICPASSASRTFIRNRNKCCAYALIADQHPGGAKHVHWMNFLHQDTAVMTGPEQFAKKLNLPIFYISGTRTQRGYYDISLKLITDKPQKTADGDITESFMRSLEQDIVREPESWLWTHKRWKMKRSQ